MLRDLLRVRYGTPASRVLGKRRRASNRWLIEFVAATSFLVIGTRDRTGNTYISPRGGPPGFLKLEDGVLCFREAAGNRLFETVGNVEEHPSVGLLLLVPGVSEMVRAFGTAMLLTDERDPRFRELAELLDTQPGDLEAVWQIRLTEWYYHCGRAVRRARLFDAEFIRENARRCDTLSEYAKKSDDFPG